MAEYKTLTPPPALYDYVLYYECADKDWIGGNSSVKTNIKGDGALMSSINWNSTYSYDPDDSGGKTLFGVTEFAWKAFVGNYPNKGYNANLNSMGKQGWIDIIGYYWNDYSCGAKSANYACAFALFQMAWGGFSNKNLEKLLKTIKTNADKKNYSFIESGGYYTKIADATHAYTNPMVAYDYIRKAKSAYLYNISAPDKTNSKYRCGWLTRNTLAFTPYGLYVTKFTYDKAGKGLQYSSSLSQWENAAIEMARENKSGYVKIFDWGTPPESIEKPTLTPNEYNYIEYNYTKSNNSSIGLNGGLYIGNCGIHQLGNYSNVQETPTKQTQQEQNREKILNTLIKGSYTPNDIKTCSELITTDKKKGIKTKSEA